ncbi:hypothetical protein MFLO_13595 [Listeria floridensis FSL S10-1187]|uniref:WxL domain-containing protein n=1 Tax=Listeria floridensis FSL S10-1187 TaxID=1265817 RepID=A0ABN0RCD1_9LIST|nr:pectate lyase-like adhesive domain-containing protein [Listeria floridensis]EUJ27201.1 hypothetical protein MFLO_13595 [Listeria floridensis FSL S10-1187]
MPQKKITLASEKEYAFQNETFQLTVSDEELADEEELKMVLPEDVAFLSEETSRENESEAVTFDETTNELTIPAKAFKGDKANLFFKSEKIGTYDLVLSKESTEETVYSNSLKFMVIEREEAVTSEEDQPTTEIVNEEKQNDGQSVKQKESILTKAARVGTTAYVTNADELEEAMKDANIGEIVVMNDFAFTQYTSTAAGEANLVVPARDLLVRGNTPDIKVDFRRRGYRMNFSTTTVNLEVRDIAIYGQNYWGPFRLSGNVSAKSQYVIDNMTYIGAQYTYSIEADMTIKGTIVNRSVNSYTSPIDGKIYNAQANQSNLEITNIIFKAGSSYTGTTENGTVLRLGTGGATGSAIVEEGAKLNLEGGGNGLSGEGAWTNIEMNGNLIVNKNAEVKITSPDNSTRGGISMGSNSKVELLDGATLSMEMNGPFTDAYDKNPIVVGTGGEFTVASGAKLSIVANNQGTSTGSLVKTGSKSKFEIGRKGSFHLSTDGTAAKNLVSIGATSTFNFADAEEIDLDARRNTHANTRLIYMTTNGTFTASIQRVKAWLVADAAVEKPSYDWYPMYDMSVIYANGNVTSATGGSILNETAKDFGDFYRTQNFKRVLFEWIPDVDVTINNLTDKQSDQNSHVIRGISNPGAWIYLTGDSAIPEGTIDAQAESDTKKYHVKADDVTGEYAFTLPDGEYLTGGNKVVAYAYLDGKSHVVESTVVDETAPDKPTLDAIKDVDAVITGSAEANSTVTIHRADDDTVFETVTAGADGKYTVTLSDTQKPLEPYISYYAVSTDAASNISEKSDVQTVSDTTAPSANPKTQIVEINSSFETDPRALLTDLKDNAGTDDTNLTLVFTKNPRMDKVGYSTAEIMITDKAGNSTVVIIPVFVEDDSSSLSDTVLLRSEGFFAAESEVPTDEAELDKFIIERSLAQAWEIPSGVDITDEIIVTNRGGLTNSANLYDEIEIQIRDVKAKIVVVVMPGTLSIKQIPDDISFGTQKIRSYEQRIKPESATKVIVEDQRADRQGWKLTATLDAPYTTTESDTLEDSLVIATKNGDGTTRYLPINDQGTTPVFEKETASLGTTEVDLNPTGDLGLMLDLLPGNIRSGRSYQTKIVWTLENSP